MKFLILSALVVLLSSAVLGDVDPNTDKVTCPILTALVTCWPQCAKYNGGIPNCCKASFWSQTFECTCIPLAGSEQTLSTADMLKAQLLCGVDSIKGFYTNSHGIVPSGQK